WVNLNLGNAGEFLYGMFYNSTVFDVTLVDMELADIDQDGDLDVLVLENYYTPQSTELALHVLEWTGDWYTSLWRSFLEFDPDKNAWFDCDMSIVDVTGNGTSDAVYSHTGKGLYNREYTNLLQIAPWGEAQVFWQSSQTSGMNAHAVADIDQDGDTDLFAYQRNLGYVWMERMDNGQFSGPNNLIDETPTGNQLVPADFNGDGITDLLTYSQEIIQTVGTAHVFGRTGPFDNSPVVPVPLTRATTYLRDIQPWDWDADGDTDLLFADDTGIAWLGNEGTGQSFSPPATLLALSSGLGNFEFALFDGDSLPDGIGVIAISNVDWQPVIWNSSTGDTLSFPQFEIRENNHFDVADADGDGDQDIVLLTRNNGVVILWNEWNSGGSITAETVIPDLSASYIYTGILMDDFDQDGDGDLVIRLNSGTFFARHLNGNGQFNDLEEIEGIFGVDVLFSGDYDLDGRLDLRGRSVIQGLDGIILISSYDTVQQAFTPVLERGTVGKTFGLVETLINSDSIPDYVNRGGFSFNVGATGFVSTPFVPAPFENYLPQSLYQNACWADLDGDGTEELITGSQEVMLYQPAFSSQQLVQGQMVWDTTQNCTFDSGLPGLPDGELLLQGQDSVQQILTTTPSGYYAGYLPDTIAQILTPVLPNGYIGKLAPQIPYCRVQARMKLTLQ
ncbi:MAG: VCBS repeat-containing protein, partial [Mameliella sp.]|nr:VCBS repeat-containing protein [Phaeodactylibacter sp.]